MFYKTELHIIFSYATWKFGQAQKSFFLWPCTWISLLFPLNTLYLFSGLWYSLPLQKLIFLENNSNSIQQNIYTTSLQFSGLHYQCLSPNAPSKVIYSLLIRICSLDMADRCCYKTWSLPVIIIRIKISTVSPLVFFLFFFFCNHFKTEFSKRPVAD